MTVRAAVLVAICSLIVIIEVQAEKPVKPYKARPARHAVTREGFVTDALLAPDRPLEVENGKMTITLNSDIFNFVDLVEHSEMTSGASRFYVGSVEGYPMSEVELSFTETGLSAIVRLPDRYIQLLAQDGGRMQVVEMDPSKIGEVEAELPSGMASRPYISELNVERVPVSRAEDDHLIDLVVFFTENAKAENGGETGTLNLITLLEGDINTGYMNTGLSTRVRVVKRSETDYDEDAQTNWRTHLFRFAGKVDGFMDDVHSVREEYGGDACMLIIAPSAFTGIAGIGYVGSSLQTAFSVSDSAYAAVTTAAHELGHNLGCWHDRTTDPRDRGQFDWARGYRNESTKSVTIMAYRCPGCTRLSVHARPEPYNGVILGDEDNNCARRIEERTPIMSSFFPTKVHTKTMTPSPSPSPSPSPTPTPTPSPPPSKSASPTPSPSPRPGPKQCKKDRRRCCVGPSTFGNKKVTLTVINKKRSRVSVYLVTPKNKEKRVAVVAKGRTQQLRHREGAVYRLRQGKSKRCLRSFKLYKSKKVKLGK